MDGVKSFLSSKTIKAGLGILFVQVLPVLAPLVGFNFDAAMGAQAAEAVQTVITSILGMIAIYGRVVAKDKIV